MPRIKSKVLCTSKFKKIDLMLNVVVTENKNKEGSIGKFQRSYVYGIDYGDGFVDIHLFPNSLSCIH